MVVCVGLQICVSIYAILCDLCFLHKFVSIKKKKKKKKKRRAAITVSTGTLGFPQLKDKQVEALDSFLSGKDTFVSLPTV